MASVYWWLGYSAVFLSPQVLKLTPFTQPTYYCCSGAFIKIKFATLRSPLNFSVSGVWDADPDPYWTVSSYFVGSSSRDGGVNILKDERNRIALLQ